MQAHWPTLAPRASGMAAADDSEWLPWSGALMAASVDLTIPVSPQGMQLEVVFSALPTCTFRLSTL